jgi:hypothetical protein
MITDLSKVANKKWNKSYLRNASMDGAAMKYENANANNQSKIDFKDIRKNLHSELHAWDNNFNEENVEYEY